MMIEDYDGADLIDAAGDRLGKVERSYIDDTGAVRFVELKMGGFRAKHRLVPVDQLERKNNALQVPFSKDVVEESPDVSSSGDTLEGETLDKVRAYYARGRDQDEDIGETDSAEASAAVPVAQDQPRETATSGSATEEGIGDKTKRAVEQVREKLSGADRGAGGDQDEIGSGSIGEIRDLGDVIEVPIVEEELVKRPVVKEVLRIRKSSMSEGRTVSADVRKEEIEVNREGDTRD